MWTRRWRPSRSGRRSAPAGSGSSAGSPILDEDLARAPGTLDEAEAAQARVKALRRVLVDLEQIVEKRTSTSAARALGSGQRKVVEKDRCRGGGAGLGGPLSSPRDPPPTCAETPPRTRSTTPGRTPSPTPSRPSTPLVTRCRSSCGLVLSSACSDGWRRSRRAGARSPRPRALPWHGAHAHLTLANRVRETRGGPRHLEPVLRRALERTSGRGSLRSIFEKDPETASWLRRLFPVMGCTLLSLGNVFPPEPGVVERVVVDEAGQCHPAYALAALMRAERALVIGDVNQLEPVVRLTAIDEQRVRRISDVAITDAELAPYRVHAENPGSAQRLADRAVKVRPQLRDHFRCQPAIIGLSDRLCGYHLAVHTPARSLVGQVPWLRDAVLLAAVEGQQVQARGSWANPQEADVVMEPLRQLSLRGVPPGRGRAVTLRGPARPAAPAPAAGGRPAEAGSRGMVGVPAYALRGRQPGHRHRAPLPGRRADARHLQHRGRARPLAGLPQRPRQPGQRVVASRARDHLIIKILRCSPGGPTRAC
ncbi:MAG: AAA domain-containing protein [bacterium]